MGEAKRSKMMASVLRACSLRGSQFACIRALERYGMAVAQVAEVYRAAGDIERILSKACRWHVQSATPR
jgi:hypothetical protein